MASEHLYNITNLGLNIHSDMLCDINRRRSSNRPAQESPDGRQDSGRPLAAFQGAWPLSKELASAPLGAWTGQSKAKMSILSAFGPHVPVMKADTNVLRDFASALTSATRRAIRSPPGDRVDGLLVQGFDYAANVSVRQALLSRCGCRCDRNGTDDCGSGLNSTLFVHPNSQTRPFPGGIT